MGCGSSSLKGEKVNDAGGAGAGAGTGETDTPARKVRTNFSEVDFTGANGDGRRGTMAVAPDESAAHRTPKISESSAEGVLGGDAPRSPAKSKNSVEKGTLGMVEEGAEGAKLEPYKSIDAEEPRSSTHAAVTQAMHNENVSPGQTFGGIPPNDEAAALKATGPGAANPIKV